MAKRTEAHVHRSAHCVECRITWDSVRDEDVLGTAERHADQRRHRVYLRESIASDLWPETSAQPRRDARPKI